MSTRALLLGLGLVGCTSPSASVEPLARATHQPIVVDEAPPLPPHEVAPLAHLDPLLEANVEPGIEALGRRAAPPDARRVLVMEPADRSTSVRGMAPSIVVGVDHPAREAVLAGRGLRLVTHPEGELVETRPVAAEPVHGEVTRRIALQPLRPLEDRWYALELDTDEPVALATRRDGDARGWTARFRPDSHPIVQRAAVTEVDGRTVIELAFSERVAGSRAASEWVVSDARGALPCAIIGPTPDTPEARVIVDCPRRPEGFVAVAFGGALETVLGTARMDDSGRTRTSARFALPEHGDVVAVAGEGME